MKNNRKLSVKEYFLYTLLALCGFPIWYLGAAFVLLEMNFVNWEQNIRLLVLFEGLLTSVVAILIYIASRE